jgi:hypothetical protein
MKFHSACQGQKTPPAIDIYPDKASEFIVLESIYILIIALLRLTMLAVKSTAVP